MHEETLYPKTKQVLAELQNLDLLHNFYLAGGTGLALQLGHRKSIDLDFFTPKYPKPISLLQNLTQYNPRVISESAGTLDLEIHDVKVSLLEYTHNLLEPLIDYQKIKIASVLDIACMKITAISSRGTRKDFIDLKFILEIYSLSKILAAFEKKYTQVKYNKLHILKSLVYFADAEQDPNPDCVVECNWKEVKEQIRTEVKQFLDI